MLAPNRGRNAGGLTAPVSADQVPLLVYLNEILATGIIFVLRYRKQETIAIGIHSPSTAFEFQKLAQDEQDHVDLIAARIAILGGEPDFTPVGLLMASHSEYVEQGSLSDMMKDDWVAARIAIDSCADMIGLLQGKDVPTVRILESLLASKKSHARTLLKLIDSFEPKKIPRVGIQSESMISEGGRV